MTPQQLTPQQPYLIQSRAIYPCPHCGNPLKSVFKPPSSTSNGLMLMIGLLLAPFIIGILILSQYYRQEKREASTTWWHCESCGWHVGVQPQRSRFKAISVKTLIITLAAAALIFFAAVYLNRQAIEDQKTIQSAPT